MQNKHRLTLAVAPPDYNLPFAIKADQCMSRSWEVSSREDVFNILLDYRADFWGDNGTVLFMYSVLLSKGVGLVKEEMDDAD